jgi:hypothetical protein
MRDRRMNPDVAEAVIGRRIYTYGDFQFTA